MLISVFPPLQWQGKLDGCEEETGPTSPHAYTYQHSGEGSMETERVSGGKRAREEQEPGHVGLHARLHPGYVCSNVILISKMPELPRVHGGRGDTGCFFLEKPVHWQEEVTQLSAEAGLGKQGWILLGLIPQ